MILDPAMQRVTNVECPKCQTKEAVFYLKSNDEQSHIIKQYVCAGLDNNCGFTWNKDDDFSDPIFSKKLKREGVEEEDDNNLFD